MSTASVNLRTPGSWLRLGLFIVIVVAVGGLVGISASPDGWYESLAKPPFNPPNWVFGPAWTILYVLIAIAGWRTFEADRRSRGMILWCIQMVLNWIWSPVWFGLHQLWPAFVVIIAIFATILAFIADRWARDRVAALLFVPYALWVAFASLLNLSVALLN